MIVGKTGNEGLGEGGFQDERCLFQKFIAPAAAVEKIEHAEIADIHVQHHRPAGRRRRKGQAQGCLLKEPGLSRQSRNAVNVMKHILGVAVQKEYVKYRSHTGYMD